MLPDESVDIDVGPDRTNPVSQGPKRGVERQSAPRDVLDAEGSHFQRLGSGFHATTDDGGLIDEHDDRRTAVSGPRQGAAELEGSKVFAKEFMARHGIPTAAFEVVHDANEAREAMGKFGFPVVLKADGLAAGKGVLIVGNQEEADDALKMLFEDRRFGRAADSVVVEECL